MKTSITDELTEVARQWDRAMVENDADAIGEFMADDWIIIGSAGNVDDKASFLALVRSGSLTHEVMECQDIRTRMYGDAAVMTARGVSGGMYRGQTFYEVERVSCVFVRQEGRWRCVLTHLSRMPGEQP